MIDENLNKLLTEVQKAKLQVLADDAVLCEALKLLFLDVAYYQGTMREGKAADPSRNAALILAMAGGNGTKVYSNEQLGEDLRALAEAVRLVDNGYKKLISFKTPEPLPTKSKVTGR